MAQLAIKGHATRGKEIIEIFKMLGGINRHDYNNADNDSLYFYIGTENNIINNDWVNSWYNDEDILIFTLEEFLEKYPYKVGDKVKAWVNDHYGVFDIQDIRWSNLANEVGYKIHGHWYSVRNLQLYKEQETPINFNSMTPVENIKEELYKWHPIVDEGEYWTDYDTSVYRDDIEKISTIVTNGTTLYTYEECPLGWGTMAKHGDWKYMRIKLD